MRMEAAHALAEGRSQEDEIAVEAAQVREQFGTVPSKFTGAVFREFSCLQNTLQFMPSTLLRGSSLLH